MKQLSKSPHMGFTLAELLISLAILGVIATFTIPKIITSQQLTQKSSIMKETAAMIAAAYQQAQINGLVSSSTRLQDLTPYFNYVSVDTSSTIDDHVGYGSLSCTGGVPCYRLHNGALLMDRDSFSGTASTNAMVMHLDMEGTYSGNTTGEEKSVQLILFYNGRIASRGQVQTGFTSSLGAWAVDSNADPTWVSW